VVAVCTAISHADMILWYKSRCPSKKWIIFSVNSEFILLLVIISPLLLFTTCDGLGGPSPVVLRDWRKIENKVAVSPRNLFQAE